MGTVFKDISADDDDHMPTEIESMCVNCQENGMTKLLLTKIPHFKEVILMSFECEACGFENNEIQSGGRIQEKGVSYEVKVDSARDLGRQVIRSENAVTRIPELDFEAAAQKGQVTTVEGVLEGIVEGLQQDQPVRLHMDPEGHAQIEGFIAKIQSLRQAGEVPFTLILRDPSGNSFVENVNAPNPDPKRIVSVFDRTKEDDHKLGIFTQEELNDTEDKRNDNKMETLQEEAEDQEEETTDEISKDEVLTFPTNCPDCNAPAETNVKMVNIPHFKEVVIMATVCEVCGHRTNEVKSGGGIEPTGTRITLRVTDSTDLSRDVLKSETCKVLIPELSFEMGGFAIGGRFTTLEGLLQNIYDELDTNAFIGAMMGDSGTDEGKQKVSTFKSKLMAFIEFRETFTIILDDPAGSSYVQNVYAPDPDPEMKVEKYERSYEENEELGINDMKTENYGEKEILGTVELEKSGDDVSPPKKEKKDEL